MYRTKKLCLLIPFLLGVTGCVPGIQRDQTDDERSVAAAGAQGSAVVEQADPVALQTPTPVAAEEHAAAAEGVTLEPGQCWVYAPIQPRPVDDSVELVVKDSTTRLKVTPAEFRQGYKRVVTQEGVVTYKVIPATYKKVVERVESRPESTRIVVEPAVYRDEEVLVTLEEAKTEVIPCTTSGTSYAGSAAAFGVCTIQKPAKTRKVTVQKLVTPERSRVEKVPALYREVSRWVVDKPAQVIRGESEDQVAQLPVEELVKSAEARAVSIPADRESFDVVRYEGAPQMVIRQTLCDEDLTEPVVQALQQQLLQQGYFPGQLDGLLGPKTLGALQHYQVDKGLASGALTLETLEALGLSSLAAHTEAP